MKFRYKKERVEFVVKKLNVVGNLFIPDIAYNTRQPAVIIVGPMTSVKEQVTGVYAKALAEKGLVTMSIDHRYFGESEGVPRQYEKFPDKIYDIQNTLSFIKKRPEVNRNQVSLLGVCLGAGYALATAAQTPGIHKLAAVAGYYRDTFAMKKNNRKDFEAKLLSGIEARKIYETGGDVVTIPAAAMLEEAAMQTKDTVEYYTKRAAVKNYQNSFAVMSREFFVGFDVQRYASKILIPFLMIHSRKALSPEWAKKFYNNVKSTKKNYVLESKGQTDFYDDPGIIEKCTSLIKKYFLEKT